jgi:zinc/manganese transport system substrate-binding protein
VVTSFSILADMVREIGGPDVEVVSLVGPDGDAHGFEPRPQDVKLVAQADLIVMNGLEFEPWMKRLLLSAGFSGPVTVATRHIVPRVMREGGEHGKAIDPHAWQSLANGQIYAANIEQALADLDPAHASDFHQRGAAYRARLASLDAWVRAELASIPATRRKVITSHHSFGYFGDAYGINFLSPAGLNADDETGAQTLGRLVTQIRRENIKALFIENMSATQMMDVIARETGAKLGGKLYSDASSLSDAAATTYETMFRHNVTVLKAAMLAD